MILRWRRHRARWVHPDTHEITKFLPRNPPARGDTVLVDGERCRVLRCPVKWDGPKWEMTGRGVKVKPWPLAAEKPQPTPRRLPPQGTRPNPQPSRPAKPKPSRSL